MQTLADWVYGYVTQKRALTLIPGYHPRYPDTQVPPLSITEVERVESRKQPLGRKFKKGRQGGNAQPKRAVPTKADEEKPSAASSELRNFAERASCAG